MQVLFAIRRLNTSGDEREEEVILDLQKEQYPWYVNLAFAVWLLAMLAGVITAAIPDSRLWTDLTGRFLLLLVLVACPLACIQLSAYSRRR